ncbi:DUF4114 domain-containing protein [Polaribacter aestuariivivens]|uniref:DUF4114 domain-containing protein n=1 Tax=Polaribacter aestuariivivens TaxID=2304626 RepID=UPI003F4908C5
MKKILLILITTVVTNLQAQSYKYIGDYTTDGTPNYLENPGDIISIETLEMINNSLPESYPVPDYNPQYITSGYDTDIKITEDADIWVTFVAEGAGYRNVLGFYTYDLENPRTQKPNPEDITIIFPNVSALGSGGGLRVGDKVKIGTFKAGTGIGWVLLANAWSSSAQKVGYGHWQLFSNKDFNPENDDELKYHNVLLSDPKNERIILGFEDIRRDYGSCDNDFNDAIFYVTANPFKAINTNNFADISEANNVTSAYDGGLESNGTLANLIAKRNFKREKSGNQNFKKKFQKNFHKKEFQNKTNTTSLIDYLPETGMYNTEIAKVSSPKDLLEITNATEIFSVDYYAGDKRVSAVLATATNGKIYDHSKVICDRLNNSSLEDVRTVKTRGHQIISSKIKRATGELEYTLSFSIRMDSKENELFSFWNIEQYPTGNYQNYQIWGSSFSQVFSIANYILDTHTAKNGLESTQVDDILPNVFVKSGKYSNGIINLNIVNKTNEKSVNFVGNIAETEVSEHIQVANTFSLSGDYNEVLSIETGVLFDIGFSLETTSSIQKDALYLADGPWGLDYLNEFAKITEFEVSTSERDYNADFYEVDRNVSAIGEVKGNINLFRHILPGDQTLNVQDYSTLNFNITNNEPVEIIIMQQEDRAWENRLRYTILANKEEKNYQIPFSDFLDAQGNKVDITNIKTIVFSIIGDYTNYKPFKISVNELAFKTNAVLSVDNFSNTENNKLKNYPNPFANSTTIKLPYSSKSVQIQVFDYLGRVVDFQKINVKGNNNTLKYNEPQLNKGIYKYLVKDDQNKTHSGTFIIN